MAISTTTDGTTRTVTLTYSGNHTKVTALMTDAARWIYEVKHRFPVMILDPEIGNRPATWNELTSLQKLNILDQAVHEDLMNAAKNYYRYAQLPPAQASIENEAEATYEL